MDVEMSMRAPFYSKATGSRTAMHINDIKNCLEVKKSREDNQPHKK